MAAATTLSGPFGPPVVPSTRPAPRGEESGVHRIERDAECEQCDVMHLAGSSRCPARRLGQVVAGKYRLDSLLGVGGMGAVYRARDEKLGADVAIKMLHPRYADHDEAVERFRIEAQGASRLAHPGIVQIRDYGRDTDGCAFMAMELMHGHPLSDVIDDGPMEPELAVRLMADALDTLHAAHRAGIVHRDLKPSNLFVVEGADGPKIKLLDFGIAKVLEESDANLTRTGVVMGTPQYMSPEQMMDAKRAGELSDVYSMGATLFEMLTGVPPITADKPAALILRVANGEITRRPDAVHPGIPAAIASVVERSLALVPTSRPRSAKAMRDELLAALEGTPHATWSQRPAPMPVADVHRDTILPVAAPRSRRRRRSLALAMLMSIAGALGGIGLVSLAGASPTTDPAAKSTSAEELMTLPDVVTFSGSASLIDPLASFPESPVAQSEANAPETPARATSRGQRAPRPTSTSATPRTTTGRDAPTQQDLVVALHRIRPSIEQCFEADTTLRFEATLVGRTGRARDIAVDAPGATQPQTACVYRALAQLRVEPFAESAHRAHGTITLTS